MGDAPLRFDDFELDLASYELRCHGKVVKLERLPMEMLILLIDKHGQLVTREEIIGKLWGNGVYHDTEQGINTAIRKIRQALKDDPENPRFIQTVVGKGYRFIAPVQANGRIAEPAVAASPQAAQPWRAWYRPAGVAAVVVVCILISFVATWRSRPPKSAATGRKVMLAVLPFDNLSSDSEQEYFADGVTEEMITQLGRVSPAHLGVIARSSVAGYKQSKPAIRDVGRALGVDYVLEGSVRRQGGHVRITAQLIHVADQTHVWADEYDRELGDILGLQREVSVAIAQRVQVQVLPIQRLTNARAVDPEVYENTLKGQYHLHRLVADEADAISNGERFFQQAVAKDPTYAPAYAGLARAYLLKAHYGTLPAQCMPLAEKFARRALELDPDLADAHDMLGQVHFKYHWNWRAAEKEISRSLELNPSDAEAHQAYADYLTAMGRLDEALLEAQRASALDPLWPDLALALGDAFKMLGRYDEAFAAFAKASDLEPKSSYPHDKMVEILGAQRRYSDAMRELRTALLLNRRTPEDEARIASVERAYAMAGFEGVLQLVVRKRLNAMQQLSKKCNISPVHYAMAYAHLGDTDASFAWLQKGVRERSPQLPLVSGMDFPPNVRSDPRYTALLHFLGLPQPRMTVTSK